MGKIESLSPPRQVFSLQKTLLLVGRAATNDIVLPQPEVSGKHASLTWTEKGWVLKDLQSTNHTFHGAAPRDTLEDLPILGPTTLQEGDLIGFGGLGCVWRLASAARPPAAVVSVHGHHPPILEGEDRAGLRVPLDSGTALCTLDGEVWLWREGHQVFPVSDQQIVQGWRLVLPIPAQQTRALTEIPGLSRRRQLWMHLQKTPQGVHCRLRLHGQEAEVDLGLHASWALLWFLAQHVGEWLPQEELLGLLETSSRQTLYSHNNRIRAALRDRVGLSPADAELILQTRSGAVRLNLPKNQVSCQLALP